MLFKGRNNAIKFVDDYGLMILEAKGKAAEEPTKGKGLNVVTLKQMLQRLPIALAHVKAGNTSENLLDEIRQMIYSLHLSKKKKKKKKKSIKKHNELNKSMIQKMKTIFMNSKNSKTSDSDILSRNLMDKIDFLYQILVFIIHGKL